MHTNRGNLNPLFTSSGNSSDESFLGSIEEGIDVLLSNFDEIYFSDSSSEPEEFSIDDITEEYISNSVDYFDEVCCSFDINANSIQ